MSKWAARFALGLSNSVPGLRIDRDCIEEINDIGGSRCLFDTIASLFTGGSLSWPFGTAGEGTERDGDDRRLWIDVAQCDKDNHRSARMERRAHRNPDASRRCEGMVQSPRLLILLLTECHLEGHCIAGESHGGIPRTKQISNTTASVTDQDRLVKYRGSHGPRNACC